MRGWFGRRETSKEPSNPFVAGLGMVPPFLAGREFEQGLIGDRLARLAMGVSPGAFVLLHGPRGNGKTALLVWSKRLAESRGIRLIDIRLGESEAPEHQPREPRGLAALLRAVSGISILGAGVNWREVPPSEAVTAIERKARRRPVLVTIDEAHTLPLKLGRSLLSAGQRWQHSGPPVMLLLAGTPDVRGRLSAMNVSFWERSKKLAIGRLGREAAAAAIRIPLEERGRSIARDALERIAQECHGYPFFLQLWGELLWHACGDLGRQVTCADLNVVRPQFDAEKADLYLDRYNELVKANLLEVAAGVSEAFAGAERMPPGPVKEAVGVALERLGGPSDPDAVLRVCGRLHDLGYIWTINCEGRPCYEQGIPSLMRYVARAAASDSEPLRS